MGILVSILLGAIVGYVCYLIALAVPFLAAFATIVGLVVFLLVVFTSYYNGWNPPARRL